jgi:hypothetical protein
MIQDLIILLIFLAAVGYMIRLAFRALRSNTCETGCGKCGAVDFSKLEKQIKEKGI